MILNFRNCLYASIISHLLICVIASIATNNGGIKKTFIVFGAHSKKNYHTLYKNKQFNKEHRPSIPFVGNKKNGSTSGHGIKNGTRSGHKISRFKKNNALRINKRFGIPTKKFRSKSITKKTQQLKQHNINAKHSKALAKHQYVKQSQNKKEFGNSRPTISEPSGKKKNSFKEKHQNKKAQELAQKKELAEVAKKRKEQEELAKEAAFIKKDLKEKELAKLEEEENKESKEVYAKKDAKPENIENKTLNKENIASPNADLDEEDMNDDQLLDFNETSSTLVLNFGGKIDSEMAMYQKYIQSEVERLWKPPLGVPRGTTCRIGFSIDRQGKIQHFEILKRSDVLIYDLSILRIAHLFKFNKKLWGKNFTIDFCQ